MYKTFKQLLNEFWEELEKTNSNLRESDAWGLLNQIAVKLDEIEDDVAFHDNQVRYHDFDDMKWDIDDLKDRVDDLEDKVKE